MKQSIVLSVNGGEHEVLVRPTETLASVLREKLLLTGTKEACGLGECGACSVLLDGYAVNSCLLLAVDAEGYDIQTIEGLTPEDGLTPLQEAFVEHGAIHCGFCTPGLIVTGTDYLRHSPSHDHEDLMRAIEGNICRCTGYVSVVRAIESATTRMQGNDASTHPTGGI